MVKMVGGTQVGEDVAADHADEVDDGVWGRQPAR